MVRVTKVLETGRLSGEVICACKKNSVKYSLGQSLLLKGLSIVIFNNDVVNNVLFFFFCRKLLFSI